MLYSCFPGFGILSGTNCIDCQPTPRWKKVLNFNQVVWFVYRLHCFAVVVTMLQLVTVWYGLVAFEIGCWEDFVLNLQNADMLLANYTEMGEGESQHIVFPCHRGRSRCSPRSLANVSGFAWLSFTIICCEIYACTGTRLKYFMRLGVDLMP